MAADLTTLANVKQWVNVTGTGDDALLGRLITSVSNFIQSWLNRNLASATYIDSYDGTGGNRLVLSNYPVTAVSSVVIDGQTIPASNSPLTPGFTFDQYSVILRGGYYFPQAQDDQQNIVVSYTAGYISMPVEIEQAAIELVSLRYSERLRPGVTSRSIGGENIAYSGDGISDSVQQLLIQYKKVVPT